MTSRGMVLACLAAALAFGVACQGPVAGDITLTLTTPNSDDGAVAFRVVSRNGTTLEHASAACAGCRLFLVAVSDTEMRAIVTGTIGAGALANVTVSDVGKPANYVATVLSAASRGFVTRPGASYTLAPATP